MMNKNYEQIFNNKDVEFDALEFNFNMLSEFKKVIEDQSYFDFIIESKNGGYFFNHALQIYNFSDTCPYCDIKHINNLFNQEYGELFNNLLCFGQDIFGNQFCFDIRLKNIVFFNVESSERKVISKTFAEWVVILLNELDYWTGKNLVVAWNSVNDLQLNQRLCPKKPFVIGGEYEVENLYAGSFPAYIKAYANIAKQIYNLPDGTKIELKVTL